MRQMHHRQQDRPQRAADERDGEDAGFRRTGDCAIQRQDLHGRQQRAQLLRRLAVDAGEGGAEQAEHAERQGDGRPEVRGAGHIQRSRRRRSGRNRAAPARAGGSGRRGRRCRSAAPPARPPAVAGILRYSLRAMMTATERPARMPSARLIARTLTTIGRRARSGARDRKAGGMGVIAACPGKSRATMSPPRFRARRR